MSFRPALALIAFACVAATGAQAQTKPDGQWHGNGGLALSLTSGNTKSNSLRLNADTARATAQDKISLGGYYHVAKNDDAAGNTQTSADKWGLNGQYDYNLTPSYYTFMRLGLNGDKLIDLRHRTALAGGLGYKVINTDATKFDVFGGLGYSTDKYRSAKTIGGKTDDSFSRTAIYLGESSEHKLSATVTARQRLEVYPGISGDKAVLANFNAGLDVAMNRSMSLGVGLVVAYNSKPAAGTKSTDTALFTGINVKFD